jgi:hypothetical protein
MGSPVFFLIASTAIAFISMRLNFSITRARLRADQAFWFAWIFLIFSAETVTSFPYFEFYYDYSFEPETRGLTILTFLASAVGFFIGSVLYRQARGAPINLIGDETVATFSKRYQGWVATAIFVVGLFEFKMNQISFQIC